LGIVAEGPPREGAAETDAQVWTFDLIMTNDHVIVA
jgi:hypothetical protein